jgi:2-polyprenyl-6-methoxyphenol hydroxylase-like FAD-dependent oxidoreductase
VTAVDTVLGAGVAGLACALVAARYGPVRLHDRSPRPAAPVVESVPAATLTLLLELGIVPADVGVHRLTRDRTVAWEQAEPRTHTGPACAHVDRAALHAALWERATHDTAVTVAGRAVAAPAGCVDATGRRAVTASAVERPPRTWTAATVTVAGPTVDGLRLAAAPDGYAYRLGSAHWTTAGWVGPGRVPRTAAELHDRVGEAGAAWLLDGLVTDPGRATLRRPAGLALPARPGGPVAIGDAALTRDALASQGLSIGLSDAWLAADPATTAADLADRQLDARRRHLRHLGQMIAQCRFAGAPAWAEYGGWVARLVRSP